MLEARLSIEPAEADAAEAFVARCEVVNIGDSPLLINIAPLSSPSLALELADASGAPVHLPPPPVPPAQVPVETLAERERRVAEFANFLPSWTPPGTYRARCHYVGGSGGAWWAGTVVSEWVEFVLHHH